MDPISSVEMLTALDRSSVVLDAQRCLHTICKFSDCEICFDVCPTGAIQPGKPPTLDNEKCVKCLACLPVCPNGAYTAEDAIPAVLDCLARLHAKQIELVCEHHSTTECGLPGSDAAVQIRGCLAGLGPGGYLAILALGAEKITARLDSCGDCPWAVLRPQVETQIANTQRLLDHWENAEAVSWFSAGDLGPPNQRPVWNAENPPLSRRDLFRLATRQGQIATARVINQDEQPDSKRRPGRERRRMVAAIRHLPEPPVNAGGIALDGLGFGEIQILETCTACGVCGSICPTGTLVYQRKDEYAFHLSYSPVDCIGCGLCSEVCASDAIRVNPAPTSVGIFGQGEGVSLLEGTLVRCEHCATLMATRPGIKYCTLCEYRRSNPLGSALPPGIKKWRNSSNTR